MSGQNPAPVSREDAKEILLTRIVPPAHHEGPVSVYLHLEQVHPGDIIRPFIGDVNDQVVVNTPSWFAWIDDHPEAYFAHSTRVVLIDLQTGKWITKNFQWWPYLNDRNIFRTETARNNEEILIYSDLIILR